MEIVNIAYVGDGYEYQNYSSNDVNLFVTNLISTRFGNSNDYIEYHIYDENGEIGKQAEWEPETQLTKMWGSILYNLFYKSDKRDTQGKNTLPQQ